MGGGVLSSFSQSLSRRDDGRRADRGRARHRVVANFLSIGWLMMFHPPPPLVADLLSGINLLTWERGANVSVSIAVRIEHKGDLRLPNGPVREGPSKRRYGPVRLGHNN